MKITQISVFLENRKGRLAEVCELLSTKDINMLALNIAETESFGVLRVVVNKPDEAVDVLRENGFVANETHVVAVEVSNEPGALAGILRILAKEDVNVEYMYGFMERFSDKAMMVFRFEDTEKAQQVLMDNGISIVGSADIRSL